MVAGNSVSPEHTRKFLADPKNLLVAGMVNDEPVGFVSAHLLDRFKDYRRKVFIYEVDVLPKFQRRGLGRVMMAKMLHIGHLASADTAFVLTNRSNAAAVGLYAAAGGREVNSDDLMFEFSL
jgi:ribosomal protein S18 acetylase RimI-like enzyme